MNLQRTDLQQFRFAEKYGAAMIIDTAYKTAKPSFEGFAVIPLYGHCLISCMDFVQLFLFPSIFLIDQVYDMLHLMNATIIALHGLLYIDECGTDILRLIRSQHLSKVGR